MQITREGAEGVREETRRKNKEKGGEGRVQSRLQKVGESGKSGETLSPQSQAALPAQESDLEGLSHEFDEDHSGAKFSHEYDGDGYKAIGLPVLELFTKYSRRPGDKNVVQQYLSQFCTVWGHMGIVWKEILIRI